MCPVIHVCTVFIQGHPVQHQAPQSREALCCPITPLLSRRFAPLWTTVAGTNRGLPLWPSLSFHCKGKDDPDGFHETRKEAGFFMLLNTIFSPE